MSNAQNTNEMTTVGRFANNSKKAQILRVTKNGNIRFLAMSNGQLLINKAFVRMYSARSIVSQYLHA